MLDKIKALKQEFDKKLKQTENFEQLKTLENGYI
jgi:CMP-2-keto-3-deoxyoctulosonic acid synthetase